MDTRLGEVLAEVEEYGRRNDPDQPEHDRRMLNLQPDTARLVAILVRLGARTRILEIGTSNGYSTIWLASAARTTGGRVTSLDRQAWKQELADANLRRAGIRDLVELRHGDASEVVRELSGPFDLVLFDADRPVPRASSRPCCRSWPTTCCCWPTTPCPTPTRSPATSRPSDAYRASST
ncbi:MAG: O-methyltransferase [Streptosporangiaceae bacterium]